MNDLTTLLWAEKEQLEKTIISLSENNINEKERLQKRLQKVFDKLIHISEFEAVKKIENELIKEYEESKKTTEVLPAGTKSHLKQPETLIEEMLKALEFCCDNNCGKKLCYKLDRTTPPFDMSKEECNDCPVYQAIQKVREN